jgi:hypothetical protein
MGFLSLPPPTHGAQIIPPFLSTNLQNKRKINTQMNPFTKLIPTSTSPFGNNYVIGSQLIM